MSAPPVDLAEVFAVALKNLQTLVESNKITAKSDLKKWNAWIDSVAATAVRDAKLSDSLLKGAVGECISRRQPNRQLITSSLGRSKTSRHEGQKI
jgi:hypothetical protein